MPPRRDSCRNSDDFFSRVVRLLHVSEKIPPTNFRNVHINWGRGRLAAFSSRASFIAQFCALNDLKLINLDHFFDGYFDSNGGWRHIFTDERLPSLASLLDEPLAIIESLRDDSIVLPACFGSFKTNFFEIDHQGYVSYCPECVSIGYHSSLHELPWLYRCPLHREPLKRLPLNGRESAYVRAVAELLRCSGSRWPEIWGREAPINNSPALLACLLRWLEEVKHCATRLRNQNAASLDEPPYSFDDIDVLLGRYDEIAHIPTELIDLFIAPPLRQQQRNMEIPINAASKLRDLARNFPLADLLWYFTKYELIISSQRSSRLLAEKEIERLREEHRDCRCNWEWDRYSGWRQRYSNSNNPDWLLCPYEYAIRELSDRWLAFAPEEASKQAIHNILLQFLDGNAAVIKNKLGYFPTSPISFPTQRGFPNCYLLPKLTFGNEIESILDMLLVAQVAAHCEELTTWLSSITDSSEPIRATPAGSTNLFLSDIDAWISTWRHLETKSTDAVARWEEGVTYWKHPSVERTKFRSP